MVCSPDPASFPLQPVMGTGDLVEKPSGSSNCEASKQFFLKKNQNIFVPLVAR